MSPRTRAICLAIAGLSVTVRGQAQASGPNAAASASASRGTAPAASASAPLALSLSLADSKLDPEAIRRAVELELKRPVVLVSDATAPEPGTPKLQVVVNRDHTLSVAYHAENGLTRSRSIELPRDARRSPELIALLSGNLSRDEAAELLAALAPRSSPPETATAAPPNAPETAATAPAPASAPVAAKAKESAQPPPPKPAPRAPSTLLRAPYPLFDLTLAHPLGTVKNSERYVLNGEFGLAYSDVGALEGVGFDVFVLRTEQTVRGVSYATFYNDTRGLATGVTGSALVNHGGGVEGATFAGLVNVQAGNVRWFSFAGLVNTYRDSSGCMASGIGNFGRDLAGCTVTGVVNWAERGSGVQVAGIVNRVRSLDGVQFAGVTNIADQISGAQIGLVNVGGQVRGVQLGLVNVAKRVDGAAIGLVSIAGNGRVQPVLWASSFMPVNLAAKFTVGLLYTQLGGGYAPASHTYSYELGGGMHLPLGPLFIEPGVHYSERRDSERSFSSEHEENVHYRLALGLDLHSVSPFAGGAVVQRFAHGSGALDSPEVTGEAFGGLAFF